MGESFAGATRHEVDLPCPRTGGDDLFAKRVGLVEHASVVEVIVDPLLDELQLAEIDNETVRVRFAASKSKSEGPVVSMDECAVPIVVVLTMSKGYVGIGLSAGDHDTNFQFA